MALGTTEGHGTMRASRATERGGEGQGAKGTGSEFHRSLMLFIELYLLVNSF